MQNQINLSGQPFHFIGVGGIGMSGLAYVLAKRDLPVSGSDLRSSNITKRLQSAGVEIFEGHDATNLDRFVPNHLHEQSQVNIDRGSTPQIICSTAINPANPEYKVALEKNWHIYHRSELLSALMQEYQAIAVAGTHGKTTTSSAIGHMLVETGLDPTIVVGGEVESWEGNARIGTSKYFVAEADESDKSLTRLSAKIGIVTNIELDHPDHYESLEEVIETFLTFEQQCEILIGCIDCQVVRDRLHSTISYSLNLNSGADYLADEIIYGAAGTTARIWEKGQILGQLQLQLLGEHNLSNALAAVAVGRYLGLEFAQIAAGLATFAGAKRRFEVRGEFGGIRFVDDYAHHPSELLVTLAAARLQVPPSGRLVAIFQPHRYSRTLTFLPEFAKAFTEADLVVLTDIYSAGETNNWEISGELLAKEVAKHSPVVEYRASLSAVTQFLTKVLQPGDLAIFLGAGNLNQIIPEVMNNLPKNQVIQPLAS
ncbi:UDP-N-acetylmuramate--L-alanine ligase [Merismopedia glauca]|uniref:UDP-N-acetylmuramate--L-alanine ligase n=1 Tax=Merismopedia glauca CCAP 1448/3 TaxID=1296344 RepID=A0A2T1C0F2_9CYAN|nr:UDP-N-acetylmuramate--L-alanine ligase [Merismopedia glauca]PSB01741.1 UDP-N-acetylmuramate--L-alanine ligase [Merismopedia glauca CCAP 1448/3]